MASTTSQPLTGVIWECHTDKGYQPMDPSTTAMLEAALASGQPTIRTKFRKFSYIVDLVKKTQRNEKTGKERPIRRIDLGSTKMTWEVKIDGDIWVPLDAKTQDLLERARNAGEQQVTGIRVRQHTYVIDLSRQKQINVATRREREIRLVYAIQNKIPSCTETGNCLSYDMGMGELDLKAVMNWTVLTPHKDYDPSDACIITQEDLGDGTVVPVVRLSCSSSTNPCIFRMDTLEKCLASNPSCPTCGQRFAIPGAQPSGTMDLSLHHDLHCDGFQGMGTWKIQYTFPSGMQHKRMPHPGKPYDGTTRVSYYPDTPEGKEAIDLLKAAFRLGYMFAVGDSVTTGRQNVVVWAGIHQKTSLRGGASEHGWPDDTAFDRLKSECVSRGVVLNSFGMSSASMSSSSAASS